VELVDTDSGQCDDAATDAQMAANLKPEKTDVPTQQQYQYDFTSNPLAHQHMYDEKERRLKSQKILAVLQDHFANCRSLSILDASCSTGIMLADLAEHFASSTGIDIDVAAVTAAESRFAGRGIQFRVMDALQTTFSDSCFDVIVCNQMYEHVPDATILMKEIFRLLKPGGVCYFGAANALRIIEPHYFLPFLSYLPKAISNIYLRMLGRGNQYYENLQTYWGLRQLVASFECIDYTIKVIAEPERFCAIDMVTPGSPSQKLALATARVAYWFLPAYVWLLKRPL
jgi:2-polyprenyl-3-methyl-5-hydroxy-6-metoxy-1,4-benzoquinol methylase